MVKRSNLRIPVSGAWKDGYSISRIPAVWLLDPEDGIYVVIAGRRYLAARPALDPVECRILDATTLEEAHGIVTPKTQKRPQLPELKRLAKRIAKLSGASPEETAFLAAIEYVTSGLVMRWPTRIASLHGKLPPEAD